MIAQAAPMGRRTRVSSDSCWPLRRADGTKFYEAPASDASLPPAASSINTPAGIEAVGGTTGSK